MLTRFRRSEGGFTLIELLIAVTILAVISVALIGMLFGYLRNAAETSTRMSESSDQQFVTTYWQTDVSSLGGRDYFAGAVSPFPSRSSVWTSGAAPAGVPSGCASIANMVIGFAWNEYPAGVADSTAAWNTTNQAAVYWTAVSGVQTQLWRTRCNGNLTPTSEVLARYLTGVPSTKCTASDGSAVACSSSSPLPAKVSITLTVQDKAQAVHNSTGYTTTITAERRQQ